MTTRKTTNVGRIFRYADGRTVRVIRDTELYKDPLYGMEILPLGAAHSGMTVGTLWKGEENELDEIRDHPPPEPFKRIVWSCPKDRSHRDDGISVTAGDNWITISIGEEQAIDSYNDQVETTVQLNREAAEQLLIVLQQALGKIPLDNE